MANDSGQKRFLTVIAVLAVLGLGLGLLLLAQRPVEASHPEHPTVVEVSPGSEAAPNAKPVRQGLTSMRRGPAKDSAQRVPSPQPFDDGGAGEERPPCVVTGIVRDRSTREPVQEARITWPGGQTSSNVSGAFDVEAREGLGQIRVVADGYRPQQISVRCESFDVVVALDRATHRIRLRVLDDEEEPLEGAGVFGGGGTLSDADGRLEFDAVCPLDESGGAICPALLIGAPRHVPVTVGPTRVGASTNELELQAVLRPTAP